MPSLRLLLQDLREWVICHTYQLQRYLLKYPYAHYRQLANKLGSSPCQRNNYDYHQELPATRREELREAERTRLKISVYLEQLKFSLLAVDQLKTVTISYIMSIVDVALALTALLLTTSPHKNAYHLPLHHLQTQNYRPKTDRNVPVDRYDLPGGSSGDEKEHTVNFKRHKNIFQKVERPLSARGRINSRDRQRTKHSQDKIVQHKESKTQNSLKPNIPKPHKQYKYLQQYERSQTKQSWEPPRTPIKQELNLSQDRYKSTPSTQPREENLQQQLPELKDMTAEFQALKRQLDFAKLSKIKKVEQSQEQEKWEDFQQDSIEKKQENLEDNDLDDSLEKMKISEEMNKTGKFNEAIIPRDLHEYSFG